MKLLGRGNHENTQDLMVLHIRQRNTRRKDLLVEVKAQGDIVFEVLRATFRQVRALNLQHLVVIDDPPQERPRVGSAFAKVDSTLCRKIPFREFIFVLGDWGVVVGGGGDRKARPTERAFLGRHLDVGDRGRREGPEVDSCVLVNLRHGKQQRKPARESRPTQSSMAGAAVGRLQGGKLELSKNKVLARARTFS